MTLQNRWARATDWTLSRFTRQPLRRGKSIAVIAGLVLLIGLVDYLTNVRVSFFVFYLVPVCMAVAWVGWEAAIITAVSTVVIRVFGDSMSAHFQSLPFWLWWNVGSGLTTFLVVIWVLHALITLQRQLERRIEDRTRALHEAAAIRERLQRELLDIGARERNAIGRELHDELGQHLVGTALAAQVLVQRLGAQNDPAAQDARAIVTWVEDGIAKARQIGRGLLLSSIEPGELGGELHELAAASSRGGVTCRFRQEGSPALADATAAAQLLRIAQEATRNALRHAHARHVDITLTGDPASTCLMVEDDGRGLPPQDERGDGLGLRIMEHRAALAGGTLALIAAPGEGTRIICRLPVAASA